MGVVISAMNQKGGVGKTTTVFNVTSALAAHGHKVLAIDFDPQGSLTIAFGCEPEEVQYTMYDALCKKRAVDSILRKVNDNLHLVPAMIDLSSAELELAPRMAREKTLAKVLGPVLDKYDYVLIDCPPSLGLLTLNALCASNYVMVPVTPEYMAMRGLKLLLETVQQVKENLNPGLSYLGVIATMYDKRTKMGSEILTKLADYDLLGVVSRSISVQESIMAGESVISRYADGKVAQQYEEVTSKIIERVG